MALASPPNPPPYGDCFRSDPEKPTDVSVIFSERLGDKKGFLYLHGALHLFLDKGQLRKHCWNRSERPLTTLIREGLNKGNYPLFVAEGEANKKLEQIRRNGYLSYCYGKFSKIEKPLVTFGFSFGDSDRHICAAIAENTELNELYVGVFGDPSDSHNLPLYSSIEQILQTRNKLINKLSDKQKEKRKLTVTYFDSKSANIWN